MPVRAVEKRLSLRISAAYPVSVCRKDKTFLAKGRTANISENGLLAVVRGCQLPAEVLVEITLPSQSGSNRTRNQTRTVLYRARIVRQQVLGNLLGLGVELLEKVE